MCVLDTRDSPARFSRLRDAFVDVGGEDMQSRMLDWLRSAPRGTVVLAGSDEGLELIARHRAELLDVGCVPMEANDETLLAMLDKERTYAAAGEQGIPAPRVRRLSAGVDIEAVSRELSYPCVLKPVHSHVFARRAKVRAKVLTADSPEDLKAVFERMSAIGVEMLVTEVIAGADDEFVSYYGYLDERGEPLLELTKRKIRQNPPHFGIGTYHATTHDPEVAEVGLRFLRAVGLRGLGNVEFKRDSTDGQLKLIECNARFTMANELIRAAGIDLALFSYNRLLGRATQPVDSYRDDARLWYPLEDVQAFLRYRRNGELSLGRWVGSLLYRQHLPVARLDDPLPALARASRQISNAARARKIEPPAARSGGSPRGATSGSRPDLARSTSSDHAWRRLRPEPHRLAPADRACDALYERIWREAADATGARIEQLAPGLFELSRDGASVRVLRQAIDIDDPVTLELARDRSLTHRRLAAAGVRVADSERPIPGRPYRLLLLDGELIDAGGQGADLREAVSPQLLAEARSAQSAVGLRLAAVDVVTQDPTRPLAEVGGAISEVCGTPELDHDDLPAAPDGLARVAIPILRRLLCETVAPMPDEAQQHR